MYYTLATKYRNINEIEIWLKKILFQGFDAFINLPHTTQSSLLKHNADMIVSLRGAVFFEKRKGGLDQVRCPNVKLLIRLGALRPLIGTNLSKANSLVR